MRNYIVDFLTYQDTQYINSDCNSITFYCNWFEGGITINDSIYLTGGKSFTISGNEGEIDKTHYKVVPDSTFVATGGYYTVIRKTYI
jgi:hypothetical protein